MQATLTNAIQSSDTSADTARLRVRCPSCALKMRVRVVHAGKCIRCPKCEARVGVPDPAAAYGVADLQQPTRAAKSRASIWRFTLHKLGFIVAADAAAFCAAGVLLGRLFTA